MNDQIHYPLIVTYKETLSGNGFLAVVLVTGKALITKDEDEVWWMSGVCPGGIIESGKTPNETFLNFRQRYGLTLFDIAEESATFEAFKESVEDFFNESDKSDKDRWAECHAAIRSGEIVPEEPFSALRKESPEARRFGIQVIRLDQTQVFKPSDNVPDVVALPAAA